MGASASAASHLGDLGWCSSWGFGIDVVFFAASLCVDFGFLIELLFIDGAHVVSGVADLVTDGMAAGGRRIVLSLRSGLDGLVIVCDCFVRFVLHLLVCSSWCFFTSPCGIAACRLGGAGEATGD